MICSTTGEGSCRTTDINYDVNCLGDCFYKYIGQTGSNGFTRGLKHYDDYIHKREKSALWKHVKEKHGGEMQEFEMRITGKYRRDPTKRQLAEAVRLRDADPKTSMNGRNEWNQVNITRLKIHGQVTT